MPIIRFIKLNYILLGDYTCRPAKAGLTIKKQMKKTDEIAF